MLLESIFLGEQTAQCYTEGIDYSPPKDAVNSEMFNEYFFSGTYPLAGNYSVLDDENTPMMVEGIDIENCDGASIADSLDNEKKSYAGSLNTCDRTSASTSKSPTNSPKLRHLNKAFPVHLEAATRSHLQQSNQVSPSNRCDTERTREQDILSTPIDDVELENKILARLAVRTIDRSLPVVIEEWEALPQIERAILLSYFESIYGNSLATTDTTCSFMLLESIVSRPLKIKRNEELLKKTVKKINGLMSKTFVDLNNLHHLEKEELEDIIFGAYFGQMAIESNLTNIFSSSLAFSQKSFITIVVNQRYAEDFEAIISTMYMPDFLKTRHDKVTKSIAFIRERLDVSYEHTNQGVSTDHIKRAPWSLNEIEAGIKLCQTLISRSKLY